EATSGTSSSIKSQSEKPPSPDSLMVILKEIAGLLHQLGNAPPVVQELLGGGEVQALCAFVRACPIKMGGIMEALHEGLKRDITTLETLASQASATSSNALPSLAEVKSRALGHAYCMYGIYSLMALTDRTSAGDNPTSP
ncbi:16459_t:CDS:2, partial [Acaulospora colombiana]